MRPIIIRLSAHAAHITPRTSFAHALKDDSRTAITLCSRDELDAAKRCPAAAIALQLKRAERAKQIYQTSIQLGHKLIEDLIEAEESATNDTE